MSDEPQPAAEQIRAALAACHPDFSFDSLTFSRLGEDGGALHTGGSDGIVYAGCAVGALTLPAAYEAECQVIASAPAWLMTAIRERDAWRSVALMGASGEMAEVIEARFRRALEVQGESR